MLPKQRTKIFVGRLPEGCSSKDLEDLFGKYGTVSECDVVGRFGFVVSFWCKFFFEKQDCTT